MAALGFLFVDPETLPGGTCFSPACPSWSDDCNYLPGNVSDNTANYADCHENSAYGFVQVLFLGAVYGVILSHASDLISDGSELLLLVPSLKGLIGSVVLPILGAVPDGAIVLFSGIGSNAAQSIEVGVGALAGSTIMLITLPWFIAIFFGRVEVEHGRCVYSKKILKLRKPGFKLFSTGVASSRDIRIGGMLMGASSLLYFIILIPSLREFFHNGEKDLDTKDVVDYEHTPFLVGVVMCTLVFVGYIGYQVKMNQDSAVSQAKADAQTDKGLASGQITLVGAFYEELQTIKLGKRLSGFSSPTPSERDALMNPTMNDTESRLRDYLYKKFRQYDRDNSGTMDQWECGAMFRDFGEPASRFPQLMKMMDKNSDGVIDFHEFFSAMETYLGSVVNGRTRSASGNEAMAINAGLRTADEDDDEDDEDEEDEMPEDIAQLKTPEEQQRAIKIRSLWMMSLGTIIVLLVSDPAVDVLSSIGTRIGIPGFYVSFFLAPFASNASELIAAYNYARKKTKAGMNISLSTLEGAGIMNNTFCTAIFFLVIYLNDTIAWSFSAETLAIVIVELIVMAMAQKKIMTLFDGIIILLLYPLSLVFIALIDKFTSLK